MMLGRVLTRSSSRIPQITRTSTIVNRRFMSKMTQTTPLEDDDDMSVEERSLKGTKTEELLRDAFAEECMAAVRYKVFADRADLEGLTGVADMFRALSRSEMKQAEHFLQYFEEESGSDLSTGLPMGSTEENLDASLQKEEFDSETMYPDASKQASEDGFEWIAELLNSMGQAEARHLEVLKMASEQLNPSSSGDVEPRQVEQEDEDEHLDIQGRYESAESVPSGKYR